MKLISYRKGMFLIQLLGNLKEMVKDKSEDENGFS